MVNADTMTYMYVSGVISNIGCDENKL